MGYSPWVAKSQTRLSEKSVKSVGVYIHQYVEVDFNLQLWTFLYKSVSKTETVEPYDDFISGSVYPQNLSFISRVLFDNLDL